MGGRIAGRFAGRAGSILAVLVLLVGCTGRQAAPSGSSPRATLTVTIDATEILGQISPLVRGVSGDLDMAEMIDAGVTVNSWGGNPASRYNYTLGSAWNAARDWQYRNTDFGNEGDVARNFLAESSSAGVAVRLAVPTLGWIARSSDENVCSFPGEDGCGDADGASCQDPGPAADPELANVRSTPAMVRQWLQSLTADGADIAFVAMDNEPDLWGYTHYDVHPTCPTYREVLERYLDYATAIRDVVPDAMLAGPVICCWFSYWRPTLAGEDAEHGDFLSWFLRAVRDHDERSGTRTLDVVDVHYYPQSEVFNDETDAETSARRLRSTRSLWDPDYEDESWIHERIEFIPRLRDLIADAYPDTPLAISEWNFGADGTMNGALAIADVLGIYGREGVYQASYWRSPEPDSPGYFAFKMFGNYDDRGSSFDGSAVAADSPDVDDVASYAALDPATGHLRVMLINKHPDDDERVRVALDGFTAASAVAYAYSGDDPGAIVPDEVATDGSGLDVALPAYSITLLDLAPQG